MEAIDFNRTLSQEAENKLSRFMDLIQSGDDNVLTSPLFDSNPNILQEWTEIFDELNAENPLIADLYDSEMSNKSKFGPRSLAKPWDERKESLIEYFENEKQRNNIQEISPSQVGRLRPLNYERVKDFIKRNTNSGLPYLKKKGLILDEAIRDVQSLLGERYPAVLFTRTQEGNKTRNVWGYPIGDTLLEMRYYRPLLDFQRKQDWRSAIVSPEAVDVGVTACMNHANQEGLNLLSIDFSAYDASLKPYLIKEGFNYIKKLYQASTHPDLDYICERFTSIGILTPDGEFTGDHGVPSGSTFTNEIDSICQFLIAKSYPHESLDKFQIQGDDGLYACKDPSKLMEWFESYGLNVNEDKSLVRTDTAQYLQLVYNDKYSRDGINVGVYPTYRALLRLCYLESFTDFSRDNIEGKDYFAIRALSILENCKYHPYFERLVKFVIDRDKYSLDVSDQGLTSYIKLREKQDGKDINFNIYQYGDYAVGIRNFESYKLMKSYI
jgi:hypothetical protein